MRKSSVVSPINVIDASLAMRIVLPSPTAPAAAQLFAEWRRAEARVLAPPLWLAECVSTVRTSVYAGAISAARGRTAIDEILDLEVEVVPTDAGQCRAAFDWAEKLGQSKAYDGFYLALAETSRAPFWTADRRLANAARQLALTWVHSVG
ncbi:MAG: type II toxin-antitoxin system VapC family toxin [Chloroflexota bacterium]